MAKITIKELAKHLNLSISTVSRALNDSYETSDETKARVKEMAAKLGYTPDIYASNLRSRKSKTIGVIVPEITNSFFSQVIDGIEEVARQNGYHVLIYLTHESFSQEVSVAKLLLDGRVDGVLMSVSKSTNDCKHIEEFKNRNIPVVLFDRVFDLFKTLKITTDDYQSGVKAAKHLIEKGCTHLAYLPFSKQLTIDERRKQGFLDSAKKAGIEVSIIDCTAENSLNKELLKASLTAPNSPDGIFAPVENLGLLVYEVCQELKIDIPQKLKVISFSNQKIAALLNPPLTTITQPAFEMGKEACSALFKALKNNFFYEEQELAVPSVLIERQSTSL